MVPFHTEVLHRNTVLPPALDSGPPREAYSSLVTSADVRIPRPVLLDILCLGLISFLALVLLFSSFSQSETVVSFPSNFSTYHFMGKPVSMNAFPHNP